VLVLFVFALTKQFVAESVVADGVDLRDQRSDALVVGYRTVINISKLVTGRLHEDTEDFYVLCQSLSVLLDHLLLTN